MISFILYYTLRMKRYEWDPAIIYRITRSGQIIISKSVIECALGIGSPSLFAIYYDFIKKGIPPTIISETKK